MNLAKQYKAAKAAVTCIFSPAHNFSDPLWPPAVPELSGY